MKTAQLKNLFLTRGDTFFQALRFESNGEPIDLSVNNEINVDIRQGITRQGKLIKKLSLGDGLEIVGEENDVLTIKMSTEITETMRGGKYYLDVQITDEENDKYTYCWGQIIVRENITD